MAMRRRPEKSGHLSGYRLVWLMVLFDLPVVEKAERDQATRFRKDLLDRGFEMAQFSVYLRFCRGPEQAAVLLREVERVLTEGGKVEVLSFTDKQYERMHRFSGRRREPCRENPTQFDLF